MKPPVAILASSQDADGTLRLDRSDRAAVQFALREAGHTVAYCPAEDVTAAQCALASGIGELRPIDEAGLEGADLAWIGCGALARGGDEFVARLAESAGASLVFDVLSCSEPELGVRTVLRDAGRGARDVLRVRGPVVLVVSPQVDRPRYISTYRLQQALRRLAAAPSANRQILSGATDALREWAPVRPRVRAASDLLPHGSAEARTTMAFGEAVRQAAATDHVLIADAATSARQLVRFLAHHGFAAQAVRAPDDDEELKSAVRAPPQHAPAVASGDPPRHPSLSAAVSRRPRCEADPPARQARQPRPYVSDATAPARPGHVARRPRPVGAARPGSRGPFPLIPDSYT